MARLSNCLALKLSKWAHYIILANTLLIYFFPADRNTKSADVAIRKVTVSLADSVDLRIILSVLYIITEVMRAEKAADGEFQENVSNFVAEISKCLSVDASV